MVVKRHHGDGNIRDWACSGGAEEVSGNMRNSPRKEGRAQSGRRIGAPANCWGTGQINLTILGTRVGNRKRCRVESRRFKSKECVHACRQRGGSAGFKSCHSPLRTEATCSCAATSHTQSMALVHTHANATRSTCHSTTDRSKQGKRISRHSRNEIPSLGRE